MTMSRRTLRRSEHAEEPNTPMNLMRSADGKLSDEGVLPVLFQSRLLNWLS